MPFIVYSLTVFLIWLVTEILLIRKIIKDNNSEWLWSVVNIMLPFIGCILFLIFHKTSKK